MTSSSTMDTIVALVWPKDSEVARVIIAVIVLLLGCALLLTGVHMLRLALERRALRRVASRLHSWRRENEKATQPTEACGAATSSMAARYPQLSLEELRPKLGELQAVAGRRRHVAKMMDTIHKLRLHRVKINLATLQQLVEHDEFSRTGTEAPRHVANFAIMLGILGTFWGLGHMVRAIGIALPEPASHVSLEAWSHSIGQVRTVLEGMRTAFSTSLVGMATAIIAGLCGVFVTARQHRLLAAIEDLAVNDLLPATVPALEDDSVLEQISGQLETAFSRLDGIATQNLQSIQELSAAQATFRSLVEDVRSITHGEASRDLERVFESVVGSNEALLELLRSLPPALETRRELEAIRTLLTATNHALRELATAPARRLDAVEPRIAPPAAAEFGDVLRRPLARPHTFVPLVIAGVLVIGAGFLAALFTVLR